MMTMVRICLVAGFTVIASAATAQEPTLAAARDLYVSAEYTNALSMLTTLASGNPAAAERQSISLYRALCHVALGNTAEATKVIEGMLVDDPLYKPDMADLPPRMRSAFVDARKRLLPNLVQQRYIVARAAYEQKEYAAAAEGFKFVLSGLADPDLATASAQSPLSDLKVLASGFHDLASKAVVPADPVADEKPQTQMPQPPVAEARVYSADDVNVTPPLTIRQVVPPFPGRVVASGVAIIDLVINEAGGVESASMATSLNPQYDRMAIGAAKSWQYQPAMLNGVPVKYRKRLQLTLVPDTQRR